MTDASRLTPVRPDTDRLFTYGTLRFRRILAALLGRVPAAVPAAVDGWRTAALRNRPYPGLVRAEGHTASGLLLHGLNPREWRVLDDFEDDEYELRRLPLTAPPDASVTPAAGDPGGAWAWAYAWISPGEVRAETWDADTFAEHQLDTYARLLEAGTAGGDARDR